MRYDYSDIIRSTFFERAQVKKQLDEFQNTLKCLDVQFDSKLINCDFDPIACELNDRRLLSLISSIQKLIYTHFDFLITDRQITVAIALSRGHFVEIETGAGKSVCVLLASMLLVLSGRRVIIVTSNDYLADRDMRSAQTLLRSQNISCSTLALEMTTLPETGVIYTSTKTFSGIMLRGKTPVLFNTNVIIDEVDSLVLDEARIPFVMSQQYSNKLFASYLDLAYKYCEAHQVPLSNSHDEIAQQVSWVSEFFDKKGDFYLFLYLVEKFRDVREKFKKDVHYGVVDDAIALIDQLSGRLEPDRKLSGGLHQIIEKIENVAITDLTKSIGKIWIFKLFSQFSSVSGCSGTLHFCDFDMYLLFQSVVYRCAKKNENFSNLGVEFFSNFDEKINRLVGHLNQESTRQPILIGVNHPAEGQNLYAELLKRGYNVRVYDAYVSNFDEEKAIVESAGEVGAVTIVTNIGGRGTDFGLTNAAVNVGGLKIIIFNALMSIRSDRQLVGRGGRQGQVGSVVRFLASDDFDSGQFFLKPLFFFINNFFFGNVRFKICRFFLFFFQFYKESSFFLERLGLYRRNGVL